MNYLILDAMSEMFISNEEMAKKHKDGSKILWEKEEMDSLYRGFFGIIEELRDEAALSLFEAYITGIPLPNSGPVHEVLRIVSLICIMKTERGDFQGEDISLALESIIGHPMINYPDRGARIYH